MGAQAAAALSDGGVLGWVPSAVPALTSMSLGQVPNGLTLDRVVRSHGWCGLPPNGYDVKAQVWHRVLCVQGTAVALWVDRSWVAHSGTAMTSKQQTEVLEQLRWCLGLDDDLADAPAVVQATRMLRSPTVWEDLVKTLLTTNCSWSATIGMVTRLVGTLGVTGCFPAPAEVLSAGEEVLKSAIRVGYRAGALVSLAEAIVTGSVTPERWRLSVVPDSEVKAEVLQLKGFGPYAAEGMLGLLGRPRGLAIDSWIRARLGGLSAAEVRERYGAAGRWAGALLWQEVTADRFSSV